MLSNTHIARAKTSHKTVKKTTATVAQGELFEHNLPPLQATVAQTFSGDFFMTIIGVAAVLTAAALYIVRRSGINV